MKRACFYKNTNKHELKQRENPRSENNYMQIPSDNLKTNYLRIKKQLKQKLIILSLHSVLLFAISCSSSENVVLQKDECANYIDCEKTPYILPFLPGKKHKVVQGNCSPQKNPWTHYGEQRYAYDFAMPVGTEIVAAQSGSVIFVRDEFTDNDHGKDEGNAILILHDDGTCALYGHLTHKGAKVVLGQTVKQGDIIALSGNSGQSPIPHLHFHVNACGDFSKCGSIPVSFRNVFPKVNILLKDEEYEVGE